MRKKLSAAAGLVTVAAAGALITSSPAFAESEDLASTVGVAAVAGPASATVANQLGSVQERTNARTEDRRRRHRHRHRRHFRRHRFHRRHRMY